MKTIRVFSVLFFLIITGLNCLSAQKIKDGETVNLNGINVTFRILNKKDVTVGGKNGQVFDRYEVYASARNDSGKSYNIRLTSNNLLSYANAESSSTNRGYIEINCINATGARLTSQNIVLRLKRHIVNATISVKEDGKSVYKHYAIVAGYYFDPGDLIEDKAIFIVPKGQELDLSVRSTL